MDYSKMTKDQMMQELEKQKHLAEAVDAKDKELAFLKQDLLKIQSNMNDKYNGMIVDLKQTNRELQNELNDLKAKTKPTEQLQETIKVLSEENQKIVVASNYHVNAFRNLMKTLQGALDNAIEMDTMVTEVILNKKGK